MQQLDTSLLLAINGFHNTWLDQFFWYVTSGYFALFSFALVSIVFLFGFSRTYLGVHYPSDVVVGWVMGTIIGYIGYRFLYKKLHQRSGSYPYTNN